MPNELDSKMDPDRPVVYQVRIQGHLGHEWTDWFGDVTLMPEDDGNTLLTGPIVDQAALYGLLKKVRDLGMPLLSVNRAEFNQPDKPAVKPSNLPMSLEKERGDERADNDSQCS